MITILSTAEADKLRSHLAELILLLDNAQTVQVDVDTNATPKHAPVVKATAPAESQSETRKSRRKGRRGVSVLTPKKVAQIKRQLLDGGMSVAKIARQYGVHMTTINCIKWGKTWKEVAPAEALVKPLEIVEIIK